MTVKQLIERLSKLPQSHQVVISKGSGEGSPLDSVPSLDTCAEVAQERIAEIRKEAGL